MDDRQAITLVGGGLAGTLLAALLARQGWAVQLLEAQRLDEAPAPERDLRTLALAAASWAELATLGITPTSVQAAPIRRIHVSFRGRPGRVLLDADDSGQPDFGHTVGYGRLLQALRARLSGLPGLTITDGCQVDEVGGSGIAARVAWRDRAGQAHSRLAPLVVVADGGGLRNGGPALSWRYRQQALSCRVETDPAGGTTAFERFTVAGPVALLPAGSGYALIWTAPAARIQALLACPEAEFLRQLQDWFGDRAGRFTACSARLAYPLTSRFQLRAAGRRVVRIANAAQTLHPVAGQGFNLGLRDATRLARLLGSPGAGDPGSPALLAAYRAARQRDRGVTSGITHLLAGAFALPLPGMALGSALGFALLDGSPLLRRGFARLMGEGVAP